jgi:hypothetical protein
MSTQKPDHITGKRSRLRRTMLLPLLILTLALGASNAFALLGITCTTPSLSGPGNGAINVALTPTLSWSGGLLSLGATYNVYFGPGTSAAELPSTPVKTTTSGSWATPTLLPGTTYVWKVVPSCLLNLASDPVRTFTTTCPPPPVPTISGPSSFFGGNTITLTSSSATGNLWSTGGTTQSIIVSAAGSYTVKVTNAGGCSATSAPFAVTSLAPISLGSVSNFAVLAGTTVTNTGASVITGDLGVSPGTSVTGFPPGVVAGGPIHAADALATQGQSDLTTAYTAAAGTPCAADLTGQDLGGLTLQPGVYCFSSSAQLTGTLTLDFMGNASSSFLFKMGSTLTTASASSVVPINSAGNIRPANIFWQVGSSATVGTGTSFLGNILALTSITLNTGAQVSGRALARNGAVTLDTNAAAICAAPVTPTISGPSSFCAPGAITLTSSSATGNLWSTGATTQSIAVSTAGTYSVKVTNAAGCSATSASYAVTANPTPATLTISGPTSFCAGSSITLTSSSATGNLWSTGVTTQSIVVSTPGSYTVRVTNASGCSTTSAAFAVTANATPTTPTISGSSSFCAGSTITLTSSSATGNLWSTGATTQSIVVSTAGSYRVTVTNAAGCSALSASYPVNAIAAPAAVSLLVPSDGAMLTTTPTLTWSTSPGATYQLNLTGATPAPGTGTSFTPSALAPGTYTWSVNAVGCAGAVPSAVRTFTIFATDFTATNATVGTPSVFNGAVTPATVALTTWAWNFGDGTPVLTTPVPATSHNYTAAGTYTATLTASNAAGLISVSTHIIAIAAIAPVCPTAGPSIVSPATGSTVAAGTVDLSWSAVTGATFYNVYEDLGAGLVLAGSPSALPSFSATNVPAGSNVRWQVGAVVPGCAEIRSSIATFNTAVATPSCPTAGPAIVSPATATTVPAGNVVLTWSAVRGATSYNVYEDLGSSLALAGSSASTSFTVVNVAAGSHVSWQVGAVVPNCSEILSALVTFNTPAPVCPTIVPSIVWPTADATVPTGSIALAWSAVSGAISYNVYEDSGTGLTLVGSSTSTSTSFNVVNTAAGSYTWQVEALFSQTCPTTKSPLSRFTTAVAATCPTISIGPAALPFATVGISYHQSLSATGGAAPYRFDVVSGPLPAGFVLSASGNLNGDPSIPGTSIFSVKVTDHNGCTRTQNFTIAVNCLTVAASLIDPADNALNLSSPLTFKWSPVSGATTYKVYVALKGTVAATPVETTATSLTISTLPGTFEWYVVASSDTCPSLESTHRTFTVAATCDDKAPTLLSPANGAIAAPGLLQFSWSAVSNAIGYKLSLSVNGAPFAVAASTTDTSISQSVPEGVIDWYVTAQFATCPEVQAKTFTVTAKKAVDCPTGTITLATPANGSSLSTPITFSWTPLGGSPKYRLWVSLDGGSPSVQTTTSSASTTQSMSSGSVEWYVEALFDQCPSITSAHGTFTVARKLDCSGNARTSPTSPSDKATGVPTPVNFVWSAVPGATGYRLWVSIAGGGAADVGSTTDTHLSRDMTVGSIEWYVETFFDACPSTLSQHARFTTVGNTGCGNATPTATSPVDGSATATSPVTFMWTAVPNATGYRVYAALADSDLVVIGTTTTETSLTEQVPPGTVTWYVEATFNGCSPTHSQRLQFSVPRAVNCAANASSPQSPASGSNLTDTAVTFVWTPVSGAIGYELWAGRADGTATVVGSTTSETQLTKHMPRTVIEWFVRTFFNGCPPLDSAHVTFTIAQAPSCDHPRPILLSPSDDASDLRTPIEFSWTAVPGASSYKLWLSSGDGKPAVVATSTTTSATVAAPVGHNHWHVEVFFDGCPSLESADGSFDVAGSSSGCSSPARPVAEVVGQVQAGLAYSVRWSSIANATLYELQEATTSDFAGATTTAVAGLSSTLSKDAVGAAAVFYYRVRAVSSCSDERGLFSETVAVAVVPVSTANQQSFAGSTEAGRTRAVIQKLFLPGSAAAASFTATVDEPWLSVAPSSGTIPAEGITLIVSADPSTLPVGTNTGTVLVTTSAAANGTSTGAGRKTGAAGAPPSSSVPVSISVVTPVSPTSRNSPLPESLIIPSVGHAAGANDSQFQSDVRVTNTSTQAMRYQINFTPTGPNGIAAMKQTIIQIDPGATTALDDILASFFGVGATADNASAAGVLEIRPLTATSSAISATPSISAVTVASSRTYNLTPSGSSYGQYIPAVPFSQFIGKSLDPAKPNVLSIQQISQSRDFTTGYRTNIGLLEASGQPADLIVSVLGKDGGILGSFPISLAGGEHRQIGGFLAAHDIFADDARIEIEVTSDTGKVSAYASVIDNLTNDPLLVYPVLKSASSALRFILPGAANLNTGSQNWRTDMRIYNPSAEQTDVTLTYLPQRGETTASKTATLSVLPGETKSLDGVVQSLFGLTDGTGGAVHVTTEASSSLVVTGRTYTDDQKSGGTYGQFIPAVTAAQSVGLKDRALQVLQLEQSTRFRTNLGLAETAGKAVTVEISLVLPDSKVTPKVRISLKPYEFLQAPIISSLGIPTAYNARVALRVVDGDGKVTAYGSVIDQVTGDPTYVPAQ